MDLSILQTFSLKVRKYSNSWGKVWWILNTIFRAFVTISIGNAIYSDEQNNFKCDTRQPGCTQVCFNRFSPINPIRFWSFQMLVLFIPTIFFYAYSNRLDYKIKKYDILYNEIKEVKDGPGLCNIAVVSVTLTMFQIIRPFLHIKDKTKKLW